MINCYLESKIRLAISLALFMKDIFCCGSDYIGETIRNSGTRFREHKKLI